MNGIREKYVAFTLALLILMSLAGCGNAKDAATDPTSQKTISAVAETEPVAEPLAADDKATLNIDVATLTLDAGSRKKVDYTYTGSNPLNWASYNTQVATVSQNGVVQAVGTGTAVISVSDGKLTSGVSIIVNEAAAKSTTTAHENPTELKLTESVPTFPKPTEPMPTTPKSTEPAPTTPPPTTPTTPTTPAATLRITSGNFTLGIGGTKKVDYAYTGNASLTWRSSNTQVATVSGGTVQAVGAGSAVITASDGKLNSQVQVTVNAPKPTEPEPTESKPTTPVAKLELSTSSMTLTVGETGTLGYTYTGTGIIRFEVEFGSVRVDQNGRVTALSTGTDYVYVTDGSMEKCCKVTVKEQDSTPKVSDIEFTNASGPLNGTYYVGNSVSWDAINWPNGADCHVTVSSSNSSVATVSSNFIGRYNKIKVNFVGEGSVTITVASTDGGANNSATFNVKTYVPEIPSNELTPEQYARAVVNAMVAAGMEEASGLGGWNLVNVKDDQLNNDNAYHVGTSFAANLYSKGCTKCNCVYIGRDGDNYQFYIQF